MAVPPWAARSGARGRALPHQAKGALSDSPLYIPATAAVLAIVSRDDRARPTWATILCRMLCHKLRRPSVTRAEPRDRAPPMPSLFATSVVVALGYVVRNEASAGSDANVMMRS